ncbi:hypothetical protein ACYATP_00070 [Lactobacillaceae bacterium Melli_B4]
MNKNEILNYLAEKRQLTAPVAFARNEFNNKKIELREIKKEKWKLLIWGCGFWFVFMILKNLYDGVNNYLTTPTDSSSDLDGIIFFVPIVLMIVLIILKRKKFIEPAQREVYKSLQALKEEENNPNYMNGVNGFPQEFYNYTDIFRLYKLISEGRADTLKEAYNLLETQHFYEDQASRQEEIRSLQQDTANSARWSAIAASIVAYNSFNNK